MRNISVKVLCIWTIVLVSFKGIPYLELASPLISGAKPFVLFFEGIMWNNSVPLFLNWVKWCRMSI